MLANIHSCQNFLTPRLCASTWLTLNERFHTSARRSMEAKTTSVESSLAVRGVSLKRCFWNAHKLKSGRAEAPRARVRGNDGHPRPDRGGKAKQE
jgi:hypothetical protein